MKETSVIRNVSLEVFRSAVLYSGLLVFVLLSAYPPDSSFVTKLNKVIVAICTANILFLIALSLFPTIAEILLIDTSERFGRNRFMVARGLGPMAEYAFCYSLVMCAKGGQVTRRKGLYIVLVGAFIWYSFTIAMGRRTIFALLIIVCYYVLFHLDAARKTRVMLVALLFLPAMFLFLPQSTVMLDSIQSSYTSSVEDYKYGGDTLTVRNDGIRYYLKELHKTGYLGTGLFSKGLSEDDPLKQGGVDYRYNPGDLGIFAVLCQFGFPGIILTVVILVFMFRDLAIIRRRGSPEHQAIAMAIHLYLVFCIVALLQIFWKPQICFWTGLMFYMVWRMREGIACNTLILRKKEGPSRHAGGENEGTS